MKKSSLPLSIIDVCKSGGCVQRACNLIARFGQNPHAVWKASNCLYSDTIANLLAEYPSFLIQIDPEPVLTPYRSEEIGCNDRAQQIAATHTSYLYLPKLLLRLGPNSSRLVISPAAQSVVVRQAKEVLLSRFRKLPCAASCLAPVTQQVL